MGQGFCLNLRPLLEVMGKVCSVFSAQWTEIAGNCSCLHGDLWRLRNQHREAALRPFLTMWPYSSVFSAPARTSLRVS